MSATDWFVAKHRVAQALKDAEEAKPEEDEDDLDVEGATYGNSIEDLVDDTAVQDINNISDNEWIGDIMKSSAIVVITGKKDLP